MRHDAMTRSRSAAVIRGSAARFRAGIDRVIHLRKDATGFFPDRRK